METQVGVAGYRIDLAVSHPAQPWRYLIGIECDGAAYHRAKSVRDRDRLRQEILESLGWTIYRIWSTDWFRDPDGELRRLLREIDRRQREVAEGTSPEERLVDPESLAAACPGPLDLFAGLPLVPVPPPEEIRTATDPPASVHLPPGASLEQRLTHYREMIIMRELPGSEPGRCILRDRMIDVMVAEWLDDPADFTAKVPRGMRESTDGRQMRHLPDICEMIAEAAREPRVAAA